MKKAILFLGVTMLFAGCGKTFTGTLRTQDNQALVINQDSRQDVVPPGNLKLLVRQGSPFGDGIIELKTMQGKDLAKISVPKDVALKALRFHLSPQDIHQSFGIEASQLSSESTQRTYRSTESCSYCGYCMTLQNGIDAKGNPTLTYSPGNSCSCPGTYEATRQDTTTYRTFQLNFIENSQKKAVFTSEPVKFVDSYIADHLTACE